MPDFLKAVDFSAPILFRLAIHTSITGRIAWRLTADMVITLTMRITTSDLKSV